MFNLEGMSPPSWAKEALDLADVSPRWLFDDSENGEALKNHLVWLLPTLFSTVGPHLAYLELAGRFKWTVPKLLRYPGFEVVAFMCAGTMVFDLPAISPSHLAHSYVSVLFVCFVPLPRAAMGMLNNGAAVLTSGSNPDSGFGWKFLALIEVGMAMLFVFKFWKVRC